MPRSVIFVELNEADRHFLDSFVAKGVLPNFAKMLNGGAFVTTTIPTWNAREAKAWRSISPWIVWPSAYTGLTSDEHGLRAFGQGTASIQGRCVWDVLDKAGVTTGVFGSLMSFPPRNHGNAQFYVPEALADSADCFPSEAQPLQEFSVFTARNYSGGFLRHAPRALSLLLQSTRSGVTPATIARFLSQVPREKLRGAHHEPERAMLQSYALMDSFEHLYTKYRPRFACINLNHVAYMQHRYWRATEPSRFSEGLSETDRRFFRSGAERDQYERKLAHRIEQSFVFADACLGRLMKAADDETVFLVATGLGQMPLDPNGDIYNPVVRLVHESTLFRAVGLRDFTVLHQMNPDVTVNFSSAEAAKQAESTLQGFVTGRAGHQEPLFIVQRVEHQVFLELELPRPGDAEAAVIRHRDRPGLQWPLAKFVKEHHTNDQSTAHHKDTGWLLAYSRSGTFNPARKTMAITEIAPTILDLFDMRPSPWMKQDFQSPLVIN